MSVMVTSQSVQQRAATATSQLRSLIGTSDLKLLSACLAEAAVEEIRLNERFLHRVRAIYQEMAAIPKSATVRKRKTPEDVVLTPLSGAEKIRVDPFGPLDPYLLLRLYGPQQLRKALSVYSMTKVKEACSVVVQRNTGTRPRDARKIASVIDYIVEHVAGPGY